MCSCQFHPVSSFKSSRGLILTPLLRHSGDREEMLLTVLVCSKLTIPPEVKCQMGRMAGNVLTKEASQKRKHDGSAKG